MANSMPSQTPGDRGSEEAGTSQPRDLSSEEQQTAAAGTYGAGAVAGSAPTQVPPATAAFGAGGGVTAWQNGKQFSALWAINQNRNSWVYVVGVGWKKLADNSDSAIVALTALGAHAKLTQTTVNYRDEADGMIHEMYVW